MFLDLSDFYLKYKTGLFLRRFGYMKKWDITKRRSNS